MDVVTAIKDLGNVDGHTIHVKLDTVSESEMRDISVRLKRLLPESTIILTGPHAEVAVDREATDKRLADIEKQLEELEKHQREMYDWMVGHIHDQLSGLRQLVSTFR